ncbi:NinB protein [compost metagenome]
MAGHRLRLTVKEETRTEGQNRFFHKLAGEVAKSGMLWQGKKRTAAQWKVLLVSGHAIATQEGAEIIPGLEGEFVNIRESTALMSIKRGASLIEYTLAFCAQHGVPVPAMEGQE